MRISYHTPVQHFSLKLDAFLSGWKCNLSGSQHLSIQFEYGAKTFLFFYTTWLLDISWELGKHCGVWFLAFWGYKETSQLREILVVSIFLHHLVCWYFECTFSWNSSSFGKSWLSWCGAPPWRHQSVSFCAKTSNLSATTVPGLKNPWLITVPGIFFLSNRKLTFINLLQNLCCEIFSEIQILHPVYLSAAPCEH